MSPPPDVAAVVLAAGAGTRLRPLTLHRTKALCPINNVPLVDLAIARAQRHTSAVAVNAHHQHEQLADHLDGRVHLSLEQPTALGTAGALGQLRRWIDGRGTLVINADTWHTDDLNALVRGWDGERARVLVKHDPQRGDFGAWRYVGACLMPWVEVARLEPVPSGLYEVSWRELAGRGALDLIPTAAPAIDCGTPSDYLAANLAASGGANVVGEGARVEGQLVRSVVWPGGVVAAGERLIEAIRVGRDLTLRPFA